MELKFSIDLYTSKVYTLNKFQLQQLNSWHSMDRTNEGENHFFANISKFMSPDWKTLQVRNMFSKYVLTPHEYTDSLSLSHQKFRSGLFREKLLFF